MSSPYLDRPLRSYTDVVRERGQRIGQARAPKGAAPALKAPAADPSISFAAQRRGSPSAANLAAEGRGLSVIPHGGPHGREMPSEEAQVLRILAKLAKGF